MTPPTCPCLICRAITPEHADHVIARALTVEASRLYARLHYAAVLVELLEAEDW